VQRDGLDHDERTGSDHLAGLTILPCACGRTAAHGCLL